MRRVASAIALLLATSTPASAFLVEVTTSVAVADADDQTVLQDALKSAVDGVLHDAIAFQPTLVVLTHAALVAGRLYIRLVVADSDGERTFEEMQEAQGPPDFSVREPVDLKL
jgi:hypothetical protein